MCQSEIESLLDRSPSPLKGPEIAKMAGLSKQTTFKNLYRLLKYGRIRKIGTNPRDVKYTTIDSKA